MELDWLVIYTKPQQERKVSQNLQKIGIESYCPTIEEIRQWTDRKKIINVPIFKSYVFVKIALNNRNKVFEVPGVLNYLFWLGKPAIVKEFEIQNLIDFLKGPYSSVKLERVVAGSNFYISEGPFKNLEGKVKFVANSYVVVAIAQLESRLKLLIKIPNFSFKDVSLCDSSGEAVKTFVNYDCRNYV